MIFQPNSNFLNYSCQWPKAAFILLAGLWLTGCVSTGPKLELMSFNSEYEVVQQQFDTCKAEGLALNTSASLQKSTAQYLAAANTLNSCLLQVEGSYESVPVDEQMKIHALTVLDFIKGGDVSKAREQLSVFERNFPSRDLFFNDYSSFLDTVNALLDGNQSAALNVNQSLKSELNRQHYWASH